ncbi:type II toxin-antitoxin system PemK/MazF family toxin [Bacillus wiedmannii]|uniref:type II toxin-antitoxin system PemK/MazF family toxin n=1 Tax=Bacillus wiedmannii TaxID=1890302 RepID=UPI0015D47CE3|nr:type II toxin-antitoxin system PemK/MazF family toxin [Bacillus wiedmannii]
MHKGEVWIYFDKDSQKRRPCVVVGNKLAAIDNDVVISKLTTFPARNEFDVTLEKWQDHGLAKPSVVRCSKLFTLKGDELLFKVAHIQGDEFEKVKQTISRYILED